MQAWVRNQRAKLKELYMIVDDSILKKKNTPFIASTQRVIRIIDEKTAKIYSALSCDDYIRHPGVS